MNRGKQTTKAKRWSLLEDIWKVYFEHGHLDDTAEKILGNSYFVVRLVITKATSLPLSDNLKIFNKNFETFCWDVPVEPYSSDMCGTFSLQISFKIWEQL